MDHHETINLNSHQFTTSQAQYTQFPYTTSFSNHPQFHTHYSPPIPNNLTPQPQQHTQYIIYKSTNQANHTHQHYAHQRKSSDLKILSANLGRLDEKNIDLDIVQHHKS